jgi:hypothetical protein
MAMTFSRPRPSGGPLARTERASQAVAPESVTLESAARGTIQPIPFEPKGPYPYRLGLDQVLGPEAVGKIAAAGRLVFHTIGDSGGVKDPAAQTLVAKGLETSFAAKANPPSFLYHLGDLVYYRGEVDNYFDQFYDAYEHYPAPIFAIPGNHDGQVGYSDKRSLEGFERNFCAPVGTFTDEAMDTGRMAMCLPYPYWILDTPLAYFIGLYTNVPEGGWMDEKQETWLAAQLKAAPDNKALFLSLHHPIYSFDDHHSGSAPMARAVEKAINEARRVPNMFLTAHVHNYQRIERDVDGKKLPFFVIGNGGYYNLHYLNVEVGHEDAQSGARLVAGVDSRHGFATIEVTAEWIEGFFTTVPRPQESWSNPAGYVEADRFSYTAKPIRLAEGQRLQLLGE